jgi:hypothetical protein
MVENDWRTGVDRRVAALETRTAVDEVHRAMVERRLHAIEDTLKWLVRLVFGGLILSLMGFAVKGGLGLG